MWDRIPMVRIDGKLYYDTGRESIMDARCGTMDGEITSTVDGTEIPTEDNKRRKQAKKNEQSYCEDI